MISTTLHKNLFIMEGDFTNLTGRRVETQRWTIEGFQTHRQQTLWVEDVQKTLK